MKLFRTVSELLFPPQCLGCGQRFAPSLGEQSAPWLCKSCRTEFERSCLLQCPECFAAYLDCTCAPSVMKRAGCVSFIKLAPYGDDRELETVRRIILKNKHFPARRGFAFCADALCEGVKKAVAVCDENMPISHTVMAHLPRTRRNLKKYGFDQAKGLAKALSSRCGIKYVDLLKRVRDGVDQKTLTVTGRSANVKGAFALRQPVKDLRVILVDDVVTTGAGMAEAVRVLKRAGAKEVIAVAVAATRKINRRSTNFT